MTDDTPKPPVCWEPDPWDFTTYCSPLSPKAQKVMDELQLASERMKQAGPEALARAVPLACTIRQAAEKTGRPAKEIYRMIRKGEIKAELGSGERLWLIPAEEVEKLMLDTQGERDASGPTEAPADSPHSITNN